MEENYISLKNFDYNISINQFKNLITFLFIINNEGSFKLLEQSPDYILEKYSRYVGEPSNINEGIEYGWGAHPILQKFIEEYHNKWGSMLNCSLKEMLKII